MAKKVLVTGASGFIGRYVVNLLTKSRYAVKAMVMPHEESRHLWEGSVETVHADLTKFEEVYKACKGVDIIIHLAALVGDAGSEQQHQRVTVGGTRNLFLCCSEKTKVVLASSITWYGDKLSNSVCSENVFSGIAQGPYSRAKQQQEQLAQDFAHKGGHVVILRPGNVYGPGSGPWLNEAIEQLASGLPSLIDGGYGNAGLAHVESVARAFVNAINAKVPSGAAFNLCDDLDISWRDFFTDLANIGSTPAPRSIPRFAAFCTALIAENAWRTLNLVGRPPLSAEAINLVGSDLKVPSDLARSQLDYKPMKSYDEAIAELHASMT